MRGAAAVELALVAIPLVLLVLALVDFARAMFVYDQLAKSARDGARYLTFFDPTVATEYPTALARNRMMYGVVMGPDDSSRKPIHGLKDSMIVICDRVRCPEDGLGNVETGSGTINLVKVTITGYRFEPVFPGAAQLAGIIFDPISVTMRQLY